MARLTAIFLLSIGFTSCGSTLQHDPNIHIDKRVADTAQSKMRVKPNKYHSSYETHVFAQFFSNGQLVDSINEQAYPMMSWYTASNDTIELVVHLGGQVGTDALLLRFLPAVTKVLLFRAVDDTRPAFRLNQKDTITASLEVPLKWYRLQLSERPDTAAKQVIYGFVDMESQDYFSKEGAIEKKAKDRLRYYFRSQYRHFDYR